MAKPSWFNVLRKPHVEIEERPEVKTQQEAPSSAPIPINKNKMKDFVVKAVGGILSQSEARERFFRPEYNLWEIKEASEADSYVKISLSKYSYLIFKAGSQLKGEDERVAYIEKRFRIMSFATGVPMNILFQEVADDLVKYSNAILIKKRIDRIPGVKAAPVFSDKIVGGYFRVDPASIKIKRDKNGNILKYEQGYGDNIREFFPRDVIHIYMDKDANNAFGTPRIIAALEDVKLLRKVEGNVSALIYRFSMPLYQWMVGLPQQGMQATQPEINKAQREIENSTLDGIVVTNERTTIKAIGAEGSALSAEGYLRYFEERVFSALGVSSSQMGRGGAKQDSESMEAQIHDTVKYIQRIMSEFIQDKILTELLFEGGYNPIFNEEDIVKFEFDEISLETKLKKENHEMLKYQSNQITFEESRRTMGMKDTVDDESRLYKNMIETKARLEEIDRTAEHQMALAKENAKNKPTTGSSSGSKSSQSSGNKSPRTSKTSGPSKQVTNNNRPQNQHGTHSVKVKEGHDIETGEHKKQFKKVFKSFIDMRNDIEEGESLEMLLPITSETIQAEMKKLIDHYSLKGISDAINEINDLDEITEYKLMPSKAIVLKDFYEEIEIEVKKHFKCCLEELKDHDCDVDKCLNKCENKLRYLIDFVLRKTYWYSYVKTGELSNVKQAYIIFNSENDSEDKREIINTKSFSIKDIPAYHSFCNCKVTYNKAEAGEN